MGDSYLIFKNDEIDAQKWELIISVSPFASPFQTKKYYEFLNKIEPKSSRVYAVGQRDKNYTGICVVKIMKEKGVKSFFSRRAIIYGGIVLLTNCPVDSLELLLCAIWDDLRREVIYIEIRNFFNYETFLKSFEKSKWDYIPYLDIRVPLDRDNLTDLLASFKYNRRREIKLTVNSGIYYKEAEDIESISEAYTILENLYKSNVKLPLPNKDFFIEYWKSGLMKVFIVIDGSKIVAGSFCPFLPGKSIYTYYYFGIRNYKPKTFTTSLAVLAAMDFGIKNHLKYIDFMGAGQPNKPYGVRIYKQGFGGELLDNGRIIKISNKLLYTLGSMIINKLKKREKNV